MRRDFKRLGLLSLSARRAWIEISIDDLDPSTTRKSLSARRAWIEIIVFVPGQNLINGSLSARRAWIEIVKLFRQNYECFVALRKESVDRNLSLSCLLVAGSLVALRKESVDRNFLYLSSFALALGRSPQGERG